MCNLYDIGPAPNQGRTTWEKLARECLATLVKTYNIRKTDPGLVVRRHDDLLEPAVMRWGFARDFNPSVNNARVEKLGTGIWSRASRERRCLIPAAAFYEWTGPKGRKQTHVIRNEKGAWLWIAGLWEFHREHGPCFTMITTEAPPWMAGIHDRMPAIFPSMESAEMFLDGEGPDTLPGPLKEALPIRRCENPLRYPAPGPPVVFEAAENLELKLRNTSDTGSNSNPASQYRRN